MGLQAPMFSVRAAAAQLCSKQAHASFQDASILRQIRSVKLQTAELPTSARAPASTTGALRFFAASPMVSCCVKARFFGLRSCRSNCQVQNSFPVPINALAGRSHMSAMSGMRVFGPDSWTLTYDYL